MSPTPRAWHSGRRSLVGTGTVALLLVLTACSGSEPDRVGVTSVDPRAEDGASTTTDPSPSCDPMPRPVRAAPFALGPEELQAGGEFEVRSTRGRSAPQVLTMLRRGPCVEEGYYLEWPGERPPFRMTPFDGEDFVGVYAVDRRAERRGTLLDSVRPGRYLVCGDPPRMGLGRGPCVAVTVRR